jgi:hypothetical protein
MRKLALIASAAAMAMTMPALAKPGQGHGAHGKGKNSAQAGHVRTRPVVKAKSGQRYGANACPPGLAAKRNGCLPPGQARKLFNVGQRVPSGYDFYTRYQDIPAAYRDQYGLTDGYRYIQRDQSIYMVDPRTSLVTRIIDLVL